MYRFSDYYFLKNKIDFKLEEDFLFSSLALLTEASNNSLCFLEDKKFISDLYNNLDNVIGLICTEEIASEVRDKVYVVVTDRPKELFFLLHNSLEDKELFETIIEDNCIISPKASIAPYNVIIKSGTIVEDFVSIRENSEIGHNCFIGCGTVIGAEGFNVYKLDGNYEMVKSRGKVVIGDSTKIMSNTVIEKSIYPDSKTIIGKNCIIANSVVVSHDAKLKDKCLLASGAVVCGFSKLGENSYMGVNSSVKQINKIGNNTKIGMGACVNFDTNDNEVIVGSIASPLRRAKVLKDYNNFVVDKIINEGENMN